MEDERITRIRARLGTGWTRDELLLLQEAEIERQEADLFVMLAEHKNMRAEIERLRELLRDRTTREVVREFGGQ